MLMLFRTRRALLAMMWAFLFVCLAALTACGSGSSTNRLSDLIAKPSPLSGSERATLQRLVTAHVQDHVYVVTNTISTTTKMDIQYNEGGDVQFVRTSDPVRIPDEATGTVKNGTAVAVIEYTGQLLKSCSGADLGRERVLAWDSLFGKDYVRLVANAPDVRSFRIALDADSTKDLGVDPKTGQRVFQTVADDVAFNLSVNTRGDPTSVTASTGPAGVSALLVPKDPRETLGPTEGLTPPSCQN